MKTVALLLMSAVVGVAVTGFNNPSFRSQVEQQLRGQLAMQGSSDGKLGGQVRNNLNVQSQGQVGSTQKLGSSQKGNGTLGTGIDAQSKSQVTVDSALKAAADSAAEAAGKLDAATQLKVGEKKVQDLITLDATAKATEKTKAQVDSAPTGGASAAVNADTTISVSGGLDINR